MIGPESRDRQDLEPGTARLPATRLLKVADEVERLGEGVRGPIRSQELLYFAAGIQPWRRAWQCRPVTFDDLAEERHVGYDLHITRAEDWPDSSKQPTGSAV